MGLDEVRERIKIKSTYIRKDIARLQLIATVDTVSEHPDGKCQITYHYKSERESMWFMTEKEFKNNFRPR